MTGTHLPAPPPGGHGIAGTPRPVAPVVYDAALFAEFNAATRRCRLADYARDRRAS